MQEVPPLFPPGDERQIITFSQLVKLTNGIKASTMRIWLRDGRIPGAFRAGESPHGGGKKHGGPRWQFHRKPLEDWWRRMHTRGHLG